MKFSLALFESIKMLLTNVGENFRNMYIKLYIYN